MDYKELILALTSQKGVSGRESKVSTWISEYLKDFCEAVCMDSTGNIYATVRSGKGPKIALSAHIDQIGFVVTDIDEEGFLKLATVGGINPSMLPACRVVIDTESGPVRAVFATTPPHLQKGEAGKPLSVDKFTVDAGENSDKIQVGDFAWFDVGPEEMLGDRILADGLDNRVGVAVALSAAELVAKNGDDINLSLILTVQEELGTRGAYVGGYRSDADEVIVLDVSFASSPGVPSHKCKDMGKGPMIGISPTLDNDISEKFKNIAKKYSLSYQIEVMAGNTSTDADVIAGSKSGIKTGLVSIPLKYMHSPGEVVSVSDVKSTTDLVYRYITECTEDCSL